MATAHRTLLALFFALLAAAPFGAQEQDEPTEPRAPLAPPVSIEEAMGLSQEDLMDVLEDRSAEEIQGYLASWMELIDAKQAELEASLEAEEGSKDRAAATGLGADRDTLIALGETIIGRLTEAGGDAAEARETIASIRESETDSLDESSTVPLDQNAAQDMPLPLLEAKLRPMTLEQVEVQLDLWLDLLQRKCIEVSKVEEVTLTSEDNREIAEYTERSIGLWQERERLIDRVNIVIAAYNGKGGDVTQAQSYVSSVIDVPPVVGWSAALAAVLTWLSNPDGGLALVAKLALALAVVLVAWFLSRVVARVADRALNRVRGISNLLRAFVTGSLRKVVMMMGIFIALSRLGLDMGPLMAAIGAAGLVVGLALQGTLSNFASGIMIMIYRPFDVGDVVSGAGNTGTVEGMTLVTTTIKSFDNQVVHIPNNMIWGDVITNVTASKTRRVDMVFGVGYDDDLAKAKDLLVEVVKGHEKVLPDPAPVVKVHELADSSVNFVVRPWVHTKDYWEVYWDLTLAIKNRFDQEGISIPFPQRDVHVHNA